MTESSKGTRRAIEELKHMEMMEVLKRIACALESLEHDFYGIWFERSKG